jgi:nucleoid-associated protein YgaU
VAVKRPLILGVVGLLLLAAALGINFVLNRKDQATAPEPAVAAAATQTPTPAPARAPPPGATPAPSFDVVRVNPQGDAVIAGRAAPEAQVHVFDGEREIGSVTADQRGQWVLLPSERLPSGRQELSLLTQPPGAPATRSDKVVVQVAPPSVASASNQPSPNPPSPDPSSPDQRAVVAPGNSLWELARRRYGRGTEYGTIYQANRGQIRDPDLIYPGQVFVMPPGP